MFAKLFQVIAVSAMVAGVVAGPVPKARAEPVVDIAARDSYSFNNWRGISSLSGFDNFYGSNNFRGNVEKQVVIEKETKVVCRRETIEIIQQRLLVIQEMAKRIITEQICEVETQTIVFEQFVSSMGSFGRDIRRQSGRSVGYDSNISGRVNSIVNSDGSLSNNDLGFNGQSNGQNTVVPSGSNWNDQSSPASVSDALAATKVARKSSASKSSSAPVVSSSAVAKPSSAVAQSSSAVAKSSSAVAKPSSAAATSSSAASKSTSAAASKSTSR